MSDYGYSKIFLLMATLMIAFISCEKEATLESIAVTEQPTKKSYIVGDEFDPSGMAITATYSDNSTKSVTPTKLEYDFKTAGTKTVTVSYTEKEKTVTTTVGGITVNDAETDPDPDPCADCGKDPCECNGNGGDVTFTGATIKPESLNWGTPNVNVIPANTYAWDTGSYIKATYTGNVTLVLNFSDGSTKDSLIANFQASTIAKFENFTPRGSLGYLSKIVPAFPVPAVLVAQNITATTHTDTIHFTFVENEFFLEYSITNSLVSVTVRGTNVPVPFGNGVLTMTALQKTYQAAISQNGKWYEIFNIFPTIAFTHPAGNLQEVCPRHFYQVAMPEE